MSYISEVPIWKSTYRLVIPEKGRPLLQGWAIVDNTVGEDWRNVELSLVAGAPQSFIQQISQPYYGRRAVVPLPTAALLTPQAHGATLAEGTATLAGTVRDSSGGVIPGVRVRALSGGVEAASAITDRNGAYELSLRGGQYEVLFELPGFRTQTVQSSRLAGGTRSRQDAVLEVGAASESVTVQGFTAPARRGVVGGVVGGLPDAPPPPPPPAAAREAYNQAAQALDAMASTSDLGDLFEYRIKEPISISRNQSALVPIINAEVDAERVSLWDRGAGSGRPLRAVWITNASGLTLDGGSMTVIDGNTFAGEGLIEPLKPGERRLLSYAADLGTLVEAKMDSAQGASGISRIRAQNGVIIQESEERAAWVYRVRSEDSRPTTLIVEHRFRPGWDLAATEEPAERASGAARYRLTVAPRAEATLTVREVRRQQAGISIDSLDDRFMLRVSQSGIRASELERQLAPVIERRGQLAAVDGRIARLEQERKTINEEQARLRENMKALRGSAEERQLLQRYTRQLDTQENRLEAIGEELAQARGERERVAAQLSELMRTLSFDISSETGR